MKFSKTKLKVFKSIRIQIRSKSWSGNRIRIILIRTDPQHWFLSLNMKQLAFLGLKWFNFFRLQVDIRRYGKYLCKTTYNVILCLNIHKMYTKLHITELGWCIYNIYVYAELGWCNEHVQEPGWSSAHRRLHHRQSAVG